MPVTIHAIEKALFKIFNNDFAFAIPPYQRPYAWTTDAGDGAPLRYAPDPHRQAKRLETRSTNDENQKIKRHDVLPLFMHVSNKRYSVAKLQNDA